MEEALSIVLTALTGAGAFKYWTIPFVAAAVGYGTNWVAIQMTFWPIEYVGKWPFGWQGVVPAHVEKMANIAIASMIGKFTTLYDLFQEMEPEEISNHLNHLISEHLEELIDEVMDEENLMLWENLPSFIKKRIYDYARKVTPGLIDNTINDIAENIESLVDLKHMVIDQLTKDKALMNRAFLEIGERELKFIIRSGFYFGLPFGFIQMFVWILMPEAWVLPIFGLLVGYATNWLAINLIFRPLHPVHFGPFVVQGLFLKRQAEIAGSFCRIVSREVLTVRQLVGSMLHGPKKKQTRALIHKNLKPLIDADAIKAVFQVVLGPREYVHLKNILEEQTVLATTTYLDDDRFNMDRAEVIEKVFTQKMRELPVEDFQDLLRPAFQEDEWILIAIGAVLGCIAGVCQLVFVFS